jgi:hypothetical protein
MTVRRIFARAVGAAATRARGETPAACEKSRSATASGVLVNILGSVLVMLLPNVNAATP